MFCFRLADLSYPADWPGEWVLPPEQADDSLRGWSSVSRGIEMPKTENGESLVLESRWNYGLQQDRLVIEVDLSVAIGR
jgi:hypothetical protein